MRKTIPVELVKDKANKFFVNSEDSLTETRRTLQLFVGDLLAAAGQYRGYKYLDVEESAPGKSIGRIYNEKKKGYDYPDETRIKFY
jgi:hypothetical protein